MDPGHPWAICGWPGSAVHPEQIAPGRRLSMWRTTSAERGGHRAGGSGKTGEDDRQAGPLPIQFTSESL